MLLAILAPGLSATAAMAAAASPVSQAWAVRIDGPTDASLVASGMAIGSAGDVFLTGSFRSGGYYLRDILTIRRSASGAPVWQRSYQPPEGSSANESPSAIIAHGTNIYVMGSITTTNGKTDFLTLKYRETGELEWSVRTERPISYIAPSAITIDPAGNIVLLESSGVLKYGPAGNLLWTYSYDGPVRAAEMRVDAGGNIYVAGTAGATSLDSTPVTFKLNPDGQELWRAPEASVNLQGGTVNGLDVDSAGHVATVARDQWYSMIWKYDANGNRQWMARYRAEEPVPVYAADVRFDANGNIIVAAQLGGDALLIKYAADGQQLWASRLTYPSWPAYLGVLDLDADGNSYVTTSYGDDVILVKVNPEGAQLWSVTYNSQENAQDSGEFLKVTPSGDIFVAGRSFYSGQNFVSLVKYTQQTVTGVATAIVTPAVQVVERGTDVVLTAETTGPGPIHFQWRKNGQLIPDATNAILSLTNVQAVDRAEYSVILSNATGRTVSPEARLSVRVPPEVFIDPTQALAYIGTDIGFAVTVAGNDFATLQWRHNGTNIPGATNGILQMSNLNAGASGSYDIVVSTFGGSTTSSAAGLQISRAVELINRTSANGGAPLFSVLPSGEFLIAASSNHLTGSTIVLHQHAPNGASLWSTAFESMEFTNAFPSHLARDRVGNIYLTGLSLQPYLAAAWVLLKFNPDGQLLWSRIHTGTNLLSHIDAFAVDPDGNSTAGALGQFGTRIVRYDSAGGLQWVFNNPAMDDDTIALAVDSSGHSYLGTTILTNGYNEVRLRKFDSTGALVWTRRHEPGIHHRLGTIAVDSAGHLIVAGNGFLPGTEEGQMFVAKYSSAGQRLWETRVGNSWREVAYIAALAIGPNDEITVLTESDDDYEPGEQSNLTRLGSHGPLKYHIPERQIFVSGQSQLALDHFGNAYVTGFGWRTASGMDAVTAKYDAYGSRHWLVYHGGLGNENWGAGLAVGVDAAGDVRVLASGYDSETGGDLGVLHYRQRDPAGAFRVQLVPDGAGTFHLNVLTEEPFQIEASTDLQSWSVVTESAAQQLLQPGATSFSAGPQRFFRLILKE